MKLKDLQLKETSITTKDKPLIDSEYIKRTLEAYDFDISNIDRSTMFFLQRMFDYMKPVLGFVAVFEYNQSRGNVKITTNNFNVSWLTHVEHIARDNWDGLHLREVNMWMSSLIENPQVNRNSVVANLQLFEQFITETQQTPNVKYFTSYVDGTGKNFIIYAIKVKKP